MRSPDPPVHMHAAELVPRHQIATTGIKHVVFPQRPPKLEPLQLPGPHDAPKDLRALCERSHDYFRDPAHVDHGTNQLRPAQHAPGRAASRSVAGNRSGAERSASPRGRAGTPCAAAPLPERLRDRFRSDQIPECRRCCRTRPEDEAFAERLVEEALLPYKSLPQHVRDDIKEYLVDELLATEEGRHRLRVAKPHAPTNVSEERSIDERVRDAIAEKAQGDK